MKPSAPDVNLARLTFADLEALWAVLAGAAGMGETIRLLDRCVEGGVGGRPLSDLPRLREALREQYEAITDFKALNLQLWKSLWLKNSSHAPPMAYVELFLCRDVYHCPPGELAQIPVPTLLAHMECLKFENKRSRSKNAVPAKRLRARRNRFSR